MSTLADDELYVSMLRKVDCKRCSNTGRVENGFTIMEDNKVLCPDCRGSEHKAIAMPLTSFISLIKNRLSASPVPEAIEMGDDLAWMPEFKQR